GACYVPASLVIELGSFHFTAVRILIGVGLMRIVIRGEKLKNGINGLDKLMLVWAAWAVISCLFHQEPSADLVYKLGLVYDACGIYFLLRIFCQSIDDVVDLCSVTAIMLLPLAVEMLCEKLAFYNAFSLLGGVNSIPYIRDGKARANGPFAHAILAGTIGAVCLPLMVGLWREHRKKAALGIVACLAIIYASTSSGPILSALFAISALWMWKYRSRMRFVRWLAVFAYIGLDLIMKDPAYFLIERMDMTGSSTGWYRARLIQSAIEHLSEWWFAGTDVTIHWMLQTVPGSANNTDITNHYLQMGVWGGLPLMLLFIAIVAKGFSLVGKTLQKMPEKSTHSRFVVWSLGASLFAHATTFISVSYFDQSIVFLYLTLAAIGSAGTTFGNIHAPEVNKQRSKAYSKQFS
ncbi:MAG TPA: O-antigen ligase family protein, partial [Nitrospirota bacterium]|nr:O-antigen ligase family protein [Nitrospirota bacterium]